MNRHRRESQARLAPRVKHNHEEAFRQALIVFWELSDRICGKRLQVVLDTSLFESLEWNRHLDSDVGKRLFTGRRFHHR